MAKVKISICLSITAVSHPCKTHRARDAAARSVFQHDSYTIVTELFSLPPPTPFFLAQGGSNPSPQRKDYVILKKMSCFFLGVVQSQSLKGYFTHLPLTSLWIQALVAFSDPHSASRVPWTKRVIPIPLVSELVSG